jgi:hypothetical protein
VKAVEGGGTYEQNKKKNEKERASVIFLSRWFARSDT